MNITKPYSRVIFSINSCVFYLCCTRYTGKCLKTGSLKWKLCSAVFADFPGVNTLYRAEFEQQCENKLRKGICIAAVERFVNLYLTHHWKCIIFASFFSFPFFYCTYQIFFILIYFFCWNGSYTFYVVNLVTILEFFNMQIDLTTDQYLYFPLEHFKES